MMGIDTEEKTVVTLLIFYRHGDQTSQSPSHRIRVVLRVQAVTQKTSYSHLMFAWARQRLEGVLNRQQSGIHL